MFIYGRAQDLAGEATREPCYRVARVGAKGQAGEVYCLPRFGCEGVGGADRGTEPHVTAAGLRALLLALRPTDGPARKTLGSLTSEA